MLEEALARTETDVEVALKAASGVVAILKKFRSAAQGGDLRELQKTMETAAQSLSALNRQFKTAKDSWDFDEEGYLSGREFVSELLQTAKQQGLKMEELDDRLYCYPFLIRLLPKDRSILIDKKRERRLRPSFLIGRLREMQRKPARFKAEMFLEALFDAYLIAVRTRERKLADTGAVIPLTEIYELLTLLPGQAKEYSLQEFARDIYLLDKSGVTRTRRGAAVSFPASTATKGAKKVLTVVTQDQQEKKYYGIAFSKEQQADAA